MSAEQLAQRSHEAYERLAPTFGYETRKASAKPWAEAPENNRRLMTAVCAEILGYVGELREERDAQVKAMELSATHWRMRADRAESALAEARNTLTGAAQILDVVKNEWGEAWSDWDQSVRNGITAALLAMELKP